jgi:hypothetical protein
MLYLTTLAMPLPRKSSAALFSHELSNMFYLFFIVILGSSHQDNNGDADAHTKESTWRVMYK